MSELVGTARKYLAATERTLYLSVVTGWTDVRAWADDVTAWTNGVTVWTVDVAAWTLNLTGGSS